VEQELEFGLGGPVGAYPHPNTDAPVQLGAAKVLQRP